MSPVIATIENLTIFPTISSTISKKSLKNPKPCHRSDNRINNAENLNTISTISR